MSQLGAEIKDWVISIVAAVALAMFIRTFIVELYLVDGPSMMPTLEHQQRLVVNKFIYQVRPPERGEILIFQYPRDKSRDFIKRVIAIPGDTIEIKDHNVYVNGELQNEDYILSKCRGDYPKTTIPEKHVFVMGDNRNNSEDSRYPDVGFVPYELLKGKAMLVFWPLSESKTLP
ncbi:signal peptidase I [Anaerovibrio sp.]|uniref:signal peptidase I n=1 Tax=Anaerovibrio sp. TaxID=1872532 RepID=UPI001B661889|nr:signal peptidase I [Anaerovibrio sp.]MBP3230859.1 signal peptidase I [Anaerovibrio sp.]MBR2143214.1 signal peptidase I [Anaerovibrio sp.]